jgi:hypothetical protein
MFACGDMGKARGHGAEFQNGLHAPPFMNVLPLPCPPYKAEPPLQYRGSWTNDPTASPRDNCSASCGGTMTTGAARRAMVHEDTRERREGARGLLMHCTSCRQRRHEATKQAQQHQLHTKRMLARSLRMAPMMKWMPPGPGGDNMNTAVPTVLRPTHMCRNTADSAVFRHLFNP